jgi:hypothetical protein
VADLATALAAYLASVERDSRLCLAQEQFAWVSGGEDVRISWTLPADRGVTAALRASVAGLPGWDESPFWHSGLRRLEGAPGPLPAPLVVRGVCWQGRPVLVEARRESRRGRLRVELLLPALLRDWPELPLRRLADGVRCYLRLVPDDLARAAPRGPGPSPGAETVTAYLTRTMPPDLYASQCFARLVEQN